MLKTLIPALAVTATLAACGTTPEAPVASSTATQPLAYTTGCEGSTPTLTVTTSRLNDRSDLDALTKTRPQWLARAVETPDSGPSHVTWQFEPTTILPVTVSVEGEQEVVDTLPTCTNKKEN